MALMRSPLLRRLYESAVPLFFGFMTLLILIFNDLLGDDDTFIIFSLLFFMTMGFFFIRWVVKQTMSILKLKKEKKQAELLHLKSQVNPHFFFNTLNNLYGLVEQDTQRARQLILKLSDMMRYSIYKGQNDLVSLGEEIEYLNNYIELHQMRYHKHIDVQFQIDVDDDQLKVMPLLFIILLENAFKHGVENLRHDAFVHMTMQASSKSIDFEIENNFDPEEINKHKGIGLENLTRRLELVYANQHTMTTHNHGDVYSVKLTLKL